MKKFLLSTCVLAALSSNSVFGQLSVLNAAGEYVGEKSGYTTLYDACEAIEVNSKGTIVVEEDGFTAQVYTGQSYSMVIAENAPKTITFDGNNKTIYFGGFNIFAIQDRGCSLTVKNATFEYTAKSTTGRAAITCGRGSLTLDNVTIKNAKSSNSNGLIQINNIDDNIPSVVFNNVILENCEATVAPAQIVLRTTTMTISGKNEFSVYVKNKLINVAGGGKELHDSNITLVLPTEAVDNAVVPVKGDVIVKGCTDRSQFTIEGTELALNASGNNLILDDKYPVYVNNVGTATENLNRTLGNITAGNSATIDIYENIEIASRLTNAPGKTLTFNGNGNQVSCSYAGQIILFNNATTPNDLTFNDVVFVGRGIVEETPVGYALFQVQNNGTLSLNNVTIKDFPTTNPQGIITATATATGTGKWNLNNVKVDAESCTVENQHITVNSVDGCTISGDNDFTLRINGEVTVAASELTNTAPLSVFVDKPLENRLVFTGTDDYSKFVSEKENMEFVSANDTENPGLIIRQYMYVHITDENGNIVSTLETKLQNSNNIYKGNIDVPYTKESTSTYVVLSDRVPSVVALSDGLISTWSGYGNVYQLSDEGKIEKYEGEGDLAPISLESGKTYSMTISPAGGVYEAYDNGFLTGIGSTLVDGADYRDNKAFDVFGRPVDDNYTGIVIRNGKKFYQK